jgi:hypothetical protein
MTDLEEKKMIARDMKPWLIGLIFALIMGLIIYLVYGS